LYEGRRSGADNQHERGDRSDVPQRVADEVADERERHREHRGEWRIRERERMIEVLADPRSEQRFVVDDGTPGDAVDREVVAVVERPDESDRGEDEADRRDRERRRTQTVRVERPRARPPHVGAVSRPDDSRATIRRGSP
jgi:hypothetical protein